MIEVMLASTLLVAPLTAGTAAVAQAQVAAASVPAEWVPFAECVSERESKGSYRARNARSTAQGRWQFLDRTWRVNGGIEWIVLRQLKAHGAAWRERKVVYQRLTVTPIYRWPSWAQDAAFVGVVTERSTGWRHWTLPGSKCQGLVPRGAR